VVGEGLSNDRTVVGRTALLAWLASLWRQPGGKPTVVLIGQRRIGKTSLLNKIKRDGLEKTRLIPVYIDTQKIGDKTEHSFLITLSKKMANAVGMEAPTLNEAPYLHFQPFLENTKAILDNQRFLLMIDESDPIFQGQFCPELPPFLFAESNAARRLSDGIIVLWHLLSKTGGLGLLLGVFQHRQIQNHQLLISPRIGRTAPKIRTRHSRI
jgi:hypothetical protein